MIRSRAGRDALIADHTSERIAARLQAGSSVSYLKDFVYGAIDGTITTFAVIAGVVGTDLSYSVVAILGVANLLADGFSMAVSNYLGTRASIQQAASTRLEEEAQIRLVPDGEREEIRQIFESKGFEGETLARIVETITSDSKLWIDTMMVEEHGVSPVWPSPGKAGGATFVAFLVLGFIPLFPFLLALAFDGFTSPFLWSATLTAFSFFGIGALKSRFVSSRWWRSGAETLLVGGAAATIAFGIGYALRDIG